MKSALYIFSIIFLQVLYFNSFSQKNELKFNLVQGPNGKPLGKITAVVQDPHGYMWFCGQDERCLYRYDGNKIISFRHNESNPNSLGMTILETIFADAEGMIWIGGAGLDEYNPNTGIFTHFLHQASDTFSLGSTMVWAISEDHNGNLWVGTPDGLDRFDKKSHKFYHYHNNPKDPKSLSSNAVRTIYQDHKGVMWFGTGFPFFDQEHRNIDGGLNRLNADGTFTSYLNNPSDPHSLINNKIGAIFEDSKGIFWVGTAGDGLHSMDRDKGIFERHLYNPAAPGNLSRPKVKSDFDHITFISEDKYGAIWIGTYEAGISQYNPVTKAITNFNMGKGFPDSSCWNGCISRDGVLWICTENSHLLYRTDINPYTIRSVKCGATAENFLEDQKGQLWVATFGNGLVCFDDKKKLIHNFRHNKTDSLSLLNDSCLGLFRLTVDTFLVGGINGIRKFSEGSQKFFKFSTTVLKDSISIGYGNVFKDKNGLMWFTTWGAGLISYDQQHNLYKHYVHEKDDSSSLASNFLNSILEDKNNGYWVGGQEGLNRLNSSTGKFKHYFSGSFVASLLQDHQGNFWVGTNQGLFRYNWETDKFSNVFDQEGDLNTFVVGGLIEDDQNNLWLVSNSEIIKYNPVSGNSLVFGKKFGIIPNTLQPWSHIYKDKTGQFCTGTDSGFFTFYPQELDINSDFNILITDIFLNSVPVLFGNTTLLNQPIEDTKNLSLGYNQNNIGFNFTSTDYREPESVKYYTMLENYDNVWRAAGTEKKIFYSNIPQGHYVFKIKAYNNDGAWVEKTIMITIDPPWWRTWWAYCMYALILLAFIFAIYRYQKQRIIRNEREKIQLRELAQAKEIEKAYHELSATQAQLIQSEKMASLGELTAGIAHEIQNPLNFVNNFSEVNKELLVELKEELDKGNIHEAKELADDVIDNQEKINFHGKRADGIVKGMLQHSRTNTGQKELTDINALADEYLRLTYHGLRAKDKSFNASMKTDFDPALQKINIIPQDIGRVFLNLFNNAFYAVSDKKKQMEGKILADRKLYEPLVSVSTKQIGNQVEIVIRDNGTGIPQKVMDKIFQPFFTTKPTGEGTGLGLSLSYDVIKGHGGELNAMNIPGNQGAEFIIRLPA